MGLSPALPVHQLQWLRVAHPRSIPFYTSQRIPCGGIVCYSAGSILETASKEKFLNQPVKCDSLLPIDFVKIDRAVVVNALTDQAVRSVFAGITTIARESQICVVAEGIENAEMLAFVQQARVQYAQGYLLGRPSETIPGVSALQDLNPLTYASSN
ncbi:MAG: EAL domain-containing protein [Ktedonobacteraceae bacterium]